jgi:hypothetical protein
MKWRAPGIRLVTRVFSPYPFLALWHLVQNSRFKVPDTRPPTLNFEFLIPET